jgi:prepilin signal peptidase PulO-like enzyme (type II secretory pathway)
LEKWRRASINPAAHYRCEQCLYQYSFRRTRIAALLRNPIVGVLATCMAFVLCTVLGGYAAKIALFLFDWDREFLPDSLLSVDYTHLAFGFLGSNLLLT